MEHQDGSYDLDPNRKVEGGGKNEEGQNLKKIDIDSNEDKTEESGSSCNGKPKKSVRWSEDLVSESPSSPKGSSSGTTLPEYEERGRSIPDLVPPINISASEFKSKVESVKGALGRWRKRVGEATRKAEDLAGNTWQHLKTSPSFTDAALGRIVQSTRVLAEGGYDKIFHQTFETVQNEELQNSFACYMSTSIGPVMGVLYVSTEKLAYCSDNPVSYRENDVTQWSYYKVTIPLHQLKAVSPSLNNHNPSEKYIQIISVDNQEFWFMGFLNYTAAVNLLKEVLEVGNVSS